MNVSAKLRTRRGMKLDESRTVYDGRLFDVTIGRWGDHEREIVTEFFTTPGFCRERMHLFFAEDLERGDPALDADEEVEAIRWPVGEIEEHLDEIEDAKTLVGLLLYLCEGRVRQP